MGQDIAKLLDWNTTVKNEARLHAVLEPEQRERLAYLIRTGTLQL